MKLWCSKSSRLLQRVASFVSALQDFTYIISLMQGLTWMLIRRSEAVQYAFWTSGISLNRVLCPGVILASQKLFSTKIRLEIPYFLYLTWKLHHFSIIQIGSYQGHMVKYRKLRISPYSVRMLENANQNNSEYEHFSRSVISVILVLSLQF